jgi:hypothetical protein
MKDVWLKICAWLKEVKKKLSCYGQGDLSVIFIIFLFFVIIYWCYLIGKTLSYKIFYEEMVKKTIVQLVKPESLR